MILCLSMQILRGSGEARRLPYPVCERARGTEQKVTAGSLGRGL